VFLFLTCKQLRIFITNQRSLFAHQSTYQLDRLTDIVIQLIVRCDANTPRHVLLRPVRSPFYGVRAVPRDLISRRSYARNWSPRREPGRDLLLLRLLGMKPSEPSFSGSQLIPSAARAGQEARPAAAIVNSPVCARTRLPLTSTQFVKVTEVCHENASRKSITKLPQKSMLREFAKASEAEIWTRVRRRYLTSFAGLRF